MNLSLPFWAGSLPFTDGPAHKQRMLQAAARRLVACARARPRLGRGRRSARPASRRALGAGRSRRPGRGGAGPRGAREAASRGGRARDHDLPLGRPDVAGGRRRRDRRASGGRLARADGVLGPSDGLVSHGLAIPRPRSPTAAASCTTRRASGSVTPGAPDGAGREPDADDHGARAADGARDRRRLSPGRGQRLRRRVAEPRAYWPLSHPGQRLGRSSRYRRLGSWYLPGLECQECKQRLGDEGSRVLRTEGAGGFARSGATAR